MDRIRSVDFLPEIFQTPTNKKFLGSTLDQLIQEPKLKKTQGYIGQRNAPGKLPGDTYLVEPNTVRENYQLEPGIVFRDVNNKVTDALSYIGLLDGLKNEGAFTDNHDRLFRSDSYSWSPFIDLDKFVNYSQYFWLKNGPNQVAVNAESIFTSNIFNIIHNSKSYAVEGFDIKNPVLTLIRGHDYTFNVSQPGHKFYIQVEPGTSGHVTWADNISSRDVMGVINNGADDGTITFNVPQSNAQDFYFSLTDIGGVDLATDAHFDTISNQLLSDVISIDGIQDLDNKTIVFVNKDPGTTIEAGWVYNNPPTVSGDYLNTLPERYQIFKITLDYTGGPDPYIRLTPLQSVNNLERFTIQYGAIYSNISFFKNSGGYLEEIPYISAPLDKLYYQDADNPDIYGLINIIDENAEPVLDISTIEGQPTYTSPNGVTFSNGMKIVFDRKTYPTSYQDKEYYIEGVGKSIILIPADELIIPEPYTQSSTSPFDTTPYDTEGFDGTLNAPIDHDYLTINRSSINRNAWSRSNRWFHIDIILKSAEYNNTVADLNNDNRAKRPIIEFKPDIKLFNYGTYGKKAVNIIDFDNTDAFSTLHGQDEGGANQTIDGYQLVDGSRVIFAADTDTLVRNKIYEVHIVDSDNDTTNEIQLVEAADAEVVENDVVLVANGLTEQGNVYTYTDGNWVLAQQKTSVNQAPLFDIFDTNGTSFSEQSSYQSTNFTGTKLFSYAEGTGTADTVLGFPLKYFSLDNLGDIVFVNNLYNDTFSYVLNSVSYDSIPISDGFVHIYTTREDFTNQVGWVESIEPLFVQQIFNIKYDGNPVILDILPKENLSIPNISIYVNGDFLLSSNYSVSEKTIQISSGVTVNDELEIKVISDETSKKGYYEVPANLSKNIFNENIKELTLGSIRKHYTSIARNLIELEGDVSGANNIRDLPDIERYGTNIIQQSSPLALASTFIRKDKYHFFNSLLYNARQYEKIKYQILDWISRNDIFGLLPGEVLDKALNELNVNKNIESSFYWSDMLPHGTVYDTTVYDITIISTDTFTTLNTYDFKNANNQGLLVYLNDEILLKDQDYVVADDGPRIQVLATLTPGDVLKIVEYDSTAGSNIPSTPTKLGLYPKFKPTIYVDDTYVTPTTMIRGHDGSVMVAAGDDSDYVILEFEKRIYNNIKVNSDIPLELADVVPGQFRVTDYTKEEVTQILSPMFLSWLNWNKLEFITQDYNSSEPKTWNYSSTGNKLSNNTPLLGNWRAIYKSLYDTDSPHTTPWEMLGLHEKPDWWEQRYGPAPYSSGNLVLWDDLELGLLKDPDGDVMLEKYARPGLTNILPVNDEGVLLMPMDTIVSNYNQFDLEKSWKFGDQGPTETSWRRSSAWPFAVQVLYALTKPAQYFSLMADRDRYTFDADINQYLYDGRYRLDSRSVEIHDTNAKHSYINWIVEYNKHNGFHTADLLANELSNMNVNLLHHMASFTDKNHLKIFTDKSSPDSTNNSLLLPDESYTLLFYKNQPFDKVIYSSVIVQKVPKGYAIYGNSKTDPFFKIHESVETSRTKTFSVGKTASTAITVNVPLDFKSGVTNIPYGYVYKNKNAVINFLAGYNRYLINKGMKFTNMESGLEVNWEAMIKEFVAWTDQGWAENSVINLNPSANSLEFERDMTIVDSLFNLNLNEQPRDQNGLPLEPADYVVNRLDNNFQIEMINEKIIGYLKFNLINYEHLLVLDNKSIFNDVVYDPLTGIRQHRLKISGFITDEWNGQLNAQGFLYNADNIEEWNSFNTYNIGDITKFKNSYWVAVAKATPQEEFDFSKWVQTDYDNISKGLLPNIATKADQMLHYYDNKTANLESDVDLMAFGLIGFRPRDYLRGLDLDDISQVNIYTNMTSTKGTMDSLNLFKGVNLNNQTINYEIFENWAVKRAEFGGSGNRAYIDLQLFQSKLTANPSLIEINDGSTTIGDQIIRTRDIYKQNEIHNNSNILPLRTDSNTDIQLPSAGFVVEDEVDIAVFDLNDLSDLDQFTIIDDSLIWVAKDTETDWNVYRTDQIDQTITGICDNLDGTITLELSANPNLALNDVITVANVNDTVNGSYKIKSVLNNEILVDGKLATNQTSLEDLSGVIYKHISARVGVPSDIVGSIHDNNINSTDKVWVDESNGIQVTLEKSLPFSALSEITDPDLTNSNFGYDVSQGQHNAGLIISDPSIGNGKLFCYNKLGRNSYQYDQDLTLAGTTTLLYGESVSLVEKWGIAGAPGDATTPGLAVIIDRNEQIQVYIEHQILVPPDLAVATDYGKFVMMSRDENWVFVSEPSVNKVHAYSKVEYQQQEMNVIADGTAMAIDITNDIEINYSDGTQIVVTVEGVTQTNTVDYVLASGILSFTAGSIPTAGDNIRITRVRADEFPSDGTAGPYPIKDIYGLNGIDSFTVIISDVIQRPYFDYTYDSINNEITFTSAIPTSTINNISVELKTYFKYESTITGSGTNFGTEVDTTPSASRITISAPDDDAVYVYERIIERSVANTTGQQVFLMTANAGRSQTHVYFNGILQVPEQFNVNADYTISTTNFANDTITMNATNIEIGDLIEFGTNEFQLIETLDLGTRINAGSRFGDAIALCQSDCSIYVGAPNDSYDLPEAGSVTRFVNQSRTNGSIQSPIQNLVFTTATDTIRVNNIEVSVGTDLNTLAANIIAAVTPNVTASVTDGYLTISLINKDIDSLSSKLDVGPGIGTAFTELALETYYNDQVLVGPETKDYAHFGTKISIGNKDDQIIVSSVIPTTADTTTYTADSTAYIPLLSTYKVYSFDILQDATKYTAGKLAFGQLIHNAASATLAGDKLDYLDGVLLIGSVNYDKVYLYDNPSLATSWNVIKSEQQPVDVDLINSVFLYDKDSLTVVQYLDYIDPLNGKILGIAQQNLDFITVYDPAVYANKYNGLLWGEAQVGKIWWDISSARFLNYNINDEQLSSELWGELFPGSTIDVYQWISSDVLPADYTGDGTVLDTTKYIAIDSVNNVGTIKTTYYYWVKDIITVAYHANKTLSVSAIADYIANPLSSGVAYATMIAPNLIGLYNCKTYLADDSTILHFGFDKVKNDTNIFIEYDLLRENYANDFLPDTLYKKLQDSFCGSDTLGNVVPDQGLNISDRFGINFRPRQSMFVDRYEALRNYLKRINNLMAQYTITEMRSYPLLETEEEAPPQTINAVIQWDEKVADLDELGYQDLTAKPIGFKYLVESDSGHLGFWTIYEIIDVNGTNTLQLYRVQSYDTKRFWETVDWYAADFNPFSKVSIVIDNLNDLNSYENVTINTVAKVKFNNTNSWELYRYEVDGWNRVGLQNGTIQFSEKLWDVEKGRFGFDVEVFDASGFDEYPVTELRYVIRSINEEILIDDLLIERNKALISVFNYILSEQPHVDWLMKTSFIDVRHSVRELSQVAVYQKDNNSYLLDYINEVKPYHTKIRDFLLNYNGIETMSGMATDFDCPAAWDATTQQYISPVLADGVTGLDTLAANYTLSTSDIWNQSPWDQWYQNYKLEIASVLVTDGGSGYTVAPTITVLGNAEVSAEMTARIVGGKVVEILIDNPGQGYTETPTISFSGGNGTGATAVAIMENNLVRNITTTMKFDRYQYESKIQFWEDNNNSLTKNLFNYQGNIWRVITPNTDSSFVASRYEQVTDANGNYLVDLDRVEKLYIREGLVDWADNDNSEIRNFVRYNDKSYQVITLNSDITFDTAKYVELDIDDLSGVDRTYGFYVADINKPGLDLSQLINGISFPGVEVYGQDFAISVTLIEVGKEYVIVTTGDTDFTLIGAADNNVGTTFIATAAGTGTGTAILSVELDVIYSSVFPGQDPSEVPAPGQLYSLANYSDSLAIYNGTRATDIDVDGGGFIDTYHSHAPEELVPGSLFDTLEMNIYSRPSGSFTNVGHAFAIDSKEYTVTAAPSQILFEGVSQFPASVILFNSTTGQRLYNTIDYNIDWSNRTITISSGISDGDTVLIYVYEVGGGTQIFRDVLMGSDLTANATELAANLSEIEHVLVFLNGTVTTDFTLTYVSDAITKLEFTNPILATDYIVLVTFGYETPQHYESYPTTETFLATPYTVSTNAMATKNAYNSIVELNGERLRPPNTAYIISDGIETDFALPYASDVIHELVPENKIAVFIDDDIQTLGIDYTVSGPNGPVTNAVDTVVGTQYVIKTVGTTDWTAIGASANIIGTVFVATGVGSGTGTANIVDNELYPRTIIFTAAPAADSIINVYEMTMVDYTISGDTVNLNTPANPGDIVGVTTFGATDQLDIFTQVFVGPKHINDPAISPFDTDPFDSAPFDQNQGIANMANEFTLDRAAYAMNRLWVTLNGQRLTPNTDYTVVNNTILTLSQAAISDTDILAVTLVSESVVESGPSFRLFIDMREKAELYNIGSSNQTYLVQDLLDTDDIIYLDDVSVLGPPDLPNGIFGVLVIDGERITFREIDAVNNTVSGLRRGTAGTSITNHVIGDIAIDMGKKSLVPWDYSQSWYTADGVPLSNQDNIPANFVKN